MNKKRLLGIILSIILVLGLTPMVCMTARAAWIGEGDGSARASYKIGTKAELEKFRDIINGTNGEVQNSDACAVLTADIDLEDAGWTPIGNEEHKYTGSFDGGGHTLSHLNASGNNVGLFGFLGNGGTVKNLTINGSVTIPDTAYQTNGYAGGVAARSEGGTVESVSVNAAIIVSETSYQGSAIIGGIVGKNEYGMICNCSNSGAVTVNETAYMGSAFVGGIVGDNKNGTIFDCNNTGNVSANTDASGASAFAGGIVGESEDGTIYHCNSTGDVSANATSSNSNAFSGGIVGKSGGGTVQNCSNTGGVTAAIDNAYVYAYAGGITGESGDAVFNCSNTGNVTVTSNNSAHTTIYAGGIVGHSDSSGTIRYVSSAGAISANGGDAAGKHAYAGGIAGFSDGTVQDACSAVGGVSATAEGAGSSHNAGGVVGYNNGSVTACYYSETGNAVGGGTAGSEPYADADAVVAASPLAWAKDNSGNLVLLGMDDDSPRTPATWNDLHDALALGGKIKLTADVTYGTGGAMASGELVVPTGKIVDLDLTGHEINRAASAGDGSVITVNGGLTITDSSEGKTGNITGGNKKGGGGGGVYIVGGSFTLYGGTISGNTADLGGGVYIESYGIFTLEDGTISSNTASTNGGGVFCDGTFKLSGGATISGNYKGTVDTDADYNNNVYLCDGKTITVTGELTSSIGVTMQTPGTITRWLGTIVSGNTPRGTAANFTSDNAAYFVVLNEDNEACIIPKPKASVTTAPTAKTLTYNGKAQDLVTPGQATNGTMQYALGTDNISTTSLTTDFDSAIPTAKDVGTYYVWYKALGDETHNDSDPKCVPVTIRKKSSGSGSGPGPSYSYYTVKFEMNGHGEQVSSQTVRSGSKAKRPQDPTAEEYYFAGWFEDAELTKEYDFSSPVRKSMTLYARWEEIRYTVSFDLDGKGSIETQWVRKNGMAEKPDDPSAEGFTFGGWYLDSDCKTPYDFSTPVTKDITLYAKWEEDVLIYRLYNPNSGGHLFTDNAAEKDSLVVIGWEYEGVAWTAPESSNTPVYRVYNPNSGEHHYTMNAAEKDILVALGWNDEGICWYSDEKQGTPLYRLYNPNATGQYAAGAHHYTKDIEERDYLIAAGWNDEGIGWYGL